tara:strand:- start:10789 stop:11289 length:501 start_codon:yes stop_codon:yes gene_type:complete
MKIKKQDTKRIRRAIAKVVAVIGTVATLVAALGCASLYPVAGAAVGAGVGSLAGVPGAVVGGASGAALGELAESDVALSDAEEFNRDVVTQLIGVASKESRDATLELVEGNSRSLVEDLTAFVLGLFKWVAFLSVAYVITRLVLSKRQEKALVEQIKKVVDEVANR